MMWLSTERVEQQEESLLFGRSTLLIHALKTNGGRGGGSFFRAVRSLDTLPTPTSSLIPPSPSTFSFSTFQYKSWQSKRSRRFLISGTRRWSEGRRCDSHLVPVSLHSPLHTHTLQGPERPHNTANQGLKQSQEHQNHQSGLKHH